MSNGEGIHLPAPRSWRATPSGDDVLELGEGLGLPRPEDRSPAALAGAWIDLGQFWRLHVTRVWQGSDGRIRIEADVLRAADPPSPPMPPPDPRPSPPDPPTPDPPAVLTAEGRE